MPSAAASTCIHPPRPIHLGQQEREVAVVELLHLGPVDDVEDVEDVRLAVQSGVEPVGVLPEVDRQDRDALAQPVGGKSAMQSIIRVRSCRQPSRKAVPSLGPRAHRSGLSASTVATTSRALSQVRRISAT